MLINPSKPAVVLFGEVISARLHFLAEIRLILLAATEVTSTGLSPSGSYQLELTAGLNSDLIHTIYKIAPGQLLSPTGGLRPPHSSPGTAVLLVLCSFLFPCLSAEASGMVSYHYMFTYVNCSHSESHLRELPRSS